MNVSAIISILLILAGAVIMLLSIVLSLRIRRLVPEDISRKWFIAIILMDCFLAGYILFVLILLFKIRFPLELVTSIVFFGGAYFVFIVMRLTRTSIFHLKEEIHERDKAKKALIASENSLKDLFDRMQDVFFRTDKEGTLTWVTPSAVKLLGCESVDDIIGRNLTDFYLVPEEKKAFLEKLSVSGKVSDAEVELGRYDGIKIIVSTSACYYRDDNGNIAGVEGVCRDVTKRRKAEEVLHVLSLTDDLTGLYNRRGLFTLAEHNLKKIKRQKTEHFLFFADLDNLKKINDAYGHSEGDRALTGFANILKTTFRESDVIARIGGDEFVVFPIALTEDDEDSIIRRLQDNLDSYNLDGDHDYRLSFSYGIARCFPDANCNVDDLLVVADKLMYRNKNQKDTVDG